MGQVAPDSTYSATLARHSSGVPDAVDASSAGLHAGADDLLVKPFSQRDLVARILALAQQPALDCGQRLQLGEIVLDTAAP